MIDQDLDSISPVKINGALLFTIKADIVKFFENEEIEFQIKVKDDKLIIEGPKILADPDLQDDAQQHETINV